MTCSEIECTCAVTRPHGCERKHMCSCAPGAKRGEMPRGRPALEEMKKKQGLMANRDLVTLGSRRYHFLSQLRRATNPSGHLHGYSSKHERASISRRLQRQASVSCSWSPLLSGTGRWSGLSLTYPPYTLVGVRQ